MSIVQNGERRRGLFDIYQGRLSSAYFEYQLFQDDGKLYNNGEWIRERNLRAESTIG